MDEKLAGMHKIINRQLICLFIIANLSACSVISGWFSSGPKTNYHTVQKGENLFRVAKMHGLSIRKVAALNRIKPPYTLYPGQRLRLTKKVSMQRNVPIKTRPQSKLGVNAKEAALIGKSISNQLLTKHKTSAKIKWHWPASGKLIGIFSPNIQKPGINLAGNLGQPVYAAANGQVIYAGDGIIGYGNLLIIKHDSVYLSAYAHNRKILANEGKRVKAGEKIAEMGGTGTDQIQLHFQIRNRGKPVNPLPFLPAVN